MKHYEQLLKMGCFTWDEICSMAGNKNTAGNLVQNYLKKGYIKSIRRGLYVAVDLADNEPAVNKFRIASKISPNAYVSHHAAFEYYGCANQVSYWLEVSSETRFMPFEFDGITYHRLLPRIASAVVTQPDGVNVTDIERTVLDNICDFEKVMGLEELLRCLELLPALHEDKLLEYLVDYNLQVLYQKAGYILEHFRSSWGLSDVFFEACKKHIGKSKRYLYSPKGRGEMFYRAQWRLLVPTNLMAITQKGIDCNA